MKELENPFVVYGYVSPTYFCDSEQETFDLITALSNGRNVTLMSPRRMGKTGLICNAFHQLQQREDVASGTDYTLRGRTLQYAFC